MSVTMDITKQGYDALTETNPNNFMFKAGLNTFKIVLEGKATAQTVNANPKTFVLAHNLGYTPSFYAFAKFPDGKTALPEQNPHSLSVNDGGRWFATVDGTNAYFTFYKFGSNYNVDIKYYFFENPLAGSSLPASNDIGVKVSKAGKDAVSGTVLDDLVFDSGYDTLKYFHTGASTININYANYYASGTSPFGTLYYHKGTAQYNHNLGYVPYFRGYIENLPIDGGTQSVIAPFITADAFEYHYDEVYADTANIYLRTEMRNFVNSGSTSIEYKYRVFRNNTGL